MNCQIQTLPFGSLFTDVSPQATWREDNTCSFCGSVSPDAFIEAFRNGEKIYPCDKPYKYYVGTGGRFFYMSHIETEAQKQEIAKIFSPVNLSPVEPSKKANIKGIIISVKETVMEVQASNGNTAVFV